MTTRNLQDIISTFEQAPTAKLSFLFRKYRKKFILSSSHIFFISECLRYKLKPNFITFKIHSQYYGTRKRLEEWIVTKWLDTERRRWHAKKDLYSRLMYHVHMKLNNACTYMEMQSLLQEVREEEAILIRTLAIKKEQKIASLLQSQYHNRPDNNSNTASTEKFAPKVINLSSASFTKEETKVLELGPKYGIPPPLNQQKLRDIVIADITATVGNDTRSEHTSTETLAR